MKILLEYVSANPNAPITVQHARAGVVGDALARILTAAGHTVDREFYVNDAPSAPLAAFIRTVVHFRRGELSDTDLFAAELAAAARGEASGDVLAAVRSRQQAVLGALGVSFDRYVSESDLLATGAVDRLLTDLTAAGHTTWRGGALWLKTTAAGDAQDRPLVRAQGGPSYLASDLAYHREKFARGYDYLIDLWDANHAGYIARTRAGLSALGLPSEKLQISLVAPVRILKEGREQRVGRYGEFLTLEELLPQLSAPALRWRLLQTPESVPLDLELAQGDGGLAALQATCTDDVSSETSGALAEAVAEAAARFTPEPVVRCLLSGALSEASDRRQALTLLGL